MKWYNKLLIGTIAMIVGYINAVIIVPNQNNKYVKVYIERNLETIIKSQEERLGIRHFGKPKIKYGYSKETIIVTKAGDIREEVRQTLAVRYHQDEDTIYIPNITAALSLTPEKSLINTATWLLFLGDGIETKEYLYHELGHFYADKLSESIGNGNWPKEHHLNIRLINEGIATYFQNTMNTKKNSFEDLDSIKIFDDDDIFKIYHVGYLLVKPVIDKHGKEGIKYLITHPPTEIELKHLQAYQNRVLEALEKLR